MQIPDLITAHRQKDELGKWMKNWWPFLFY